MSADEFTYLQQALFAVFAPVAGWLLALVLATLVGGAFLELYFEFANWLLGMAGE